MSLLVRAFIATAEALGALFEAIDGAETSEPDREAMMVAAEKLASITAKIKFSTLREG